jgi:hypothetical protein
MKTLILAVCLGGVIFMQGCVAYGEPVGGYYLRGSVWYYRDRGGREWHENHRWHHGPEDEHH